jgi:hypothetical protein
MPTPTDGGGWQFLKSETTGGNMSDLKVTVQEQSKSNQEVKVEKVAPGERQKWETPAMEDVSEQVMAQPYIRFT